MRVKAHLLACLVIFVVGFLPLSEAQEWTRYEVDTTATSIGNARICADDSGLLHIFYTKGYQLTHAQGVGGDWTYHGTGFNTRFASFAIDRSFVIHGISTNFNGDAVLYFRFSPTDSLQDTVAITSGRFTGPYLTLDSSDTPIVSFNRSDRDSLYFAVLSQGNWNIEPIARVTPGALATAIEYQDQTVYIAASSSGPPGAIGLAKRQNNIWQFETVAYDDIYGTFGFDIDDAGRGYFALGRDFQEYLYPLQFYSETDTGWIGTVLDTSGTIMGSALGVHASSANSIDIIYAMFSYDSGFAYLKYAYKMDGAWYFEKIDSVSIGYDGAVCVTPDGLIHTCYVKDDGTRAKLVYAYRQRPVSAVDYGVVPQPITPDPIRNVSPNPTNGFIKISFELNSPDRVNIDLIDSLGRLVKPILANAYFEGGQEHSLSLDLSTIPHLSSGVYFVKLKGAYHSSIKKIVILK